MIRTPTTTLASSLRLAILFGLAAWSAAAQERTVSFDDPVSGLRIRFRSEYRPVGTRPEDGALLARFVRVPDSELPALGRRESEIWLVDLELEAFEAFRDHHLKGWDLQRLSESELHLEKGGRRGWALVGVASRHAFAIVGLCDADELEAQLPVFRRAASSVRVQRTKRAALAWSDEEQADQRRALERRAPGGWRVLESHHYLILIAPKTGDWVKGIPERLEALRESLQAHFPSPGEDGPLNVVRICADRADYLAHGGVPDAAGVWSARRSELLLYPVRVGKAGSSLDDTFIALQHEAFHQHLAASIGTLQPAPWFDEGLGDVFGAAVIEGEKLMRFEKNVWRAPRLKRLIERGGPMPLDRLLQSTKGEYYRGGVAYYAAGWSFAHFLMTSESVLEHPRWCGIVSRYWTALRDASSETLDPAGRREAAHRSAFEGVDLEKLEVAWREFIESLPE
ncbi:MAG: hypothetical protein RL885_07520 [Planctomycetota bacterium]